MTGASFNDRKKSFRSGLWLLDEVCAFLQAEVAEHGRAPRETSATVVSGSSVDIPIQKEASTIVFVAVGRHLHVFRTKVEVYRSQHMVV